MMEEVESNILGRKGMQGINNFGKKRLKGPALAENAPENERTLLHKTYQTDVYPPLVSCSLYHSKT